MPTCRECKKHYLYNRSVGYSETHCSDNCDRNERSRKQRERIKELENELAKSVEEKEELNEKVESLKKQLPESMQHCTIQFKSCPKGHGWLTATNWIQHGCPTCERDNLRKEIKRLKSKNKELLEDLNFFSREVDIPIKLYELKKCEGCTRKFCPDCWND